MTMTAASPTDQYHRLKRRLSFGSMIRSRSGRLMHRRRLSECAGVGVGGDDDSSTSSTMSVGLNSALKSPFLTPPTQAPAAVQASPAAVVVKREVRFNEEENKVHENKVMCKEECKSLWYRAIDYRNFRKSASALAREIALSEQKNKAPCSYRRVMLSVYEACCQANVETQVGVLTEDQEKHLKRWMDVSTSRLGTEKLSIRPIGRDRNNRRNDMMELVIEIQEMNAAVDAETKTEFIRKTCEAISRAPRLFARHLGQAQAASMIH